MTSHTLIILVAQFLGFTLNQLQLLHLLFYPYQINLLCLITFYLQLFQILGLLMGLLYTFDDLKFISNFKFPLISSLNFSLFINQMLKLKKFFLFFMNLFFLFVEAYCFSLINFLLILIKLKFSIIFCFTNYFNQLYNNHFKLAIQIF